MKKVISIAAIIILFIIYNLTVAQQYQDGRFLRGEKYSQFTVVSTDADFYVSPKGNDNWSGTLADPNKDKTDGPFATIKKAKDAVGKLKIKIYKLKEVAVDLRFKGSLHNYGEGKDILVLIRDGNYKFESTLVFSSFDGGERIETNLPTGAF